MSYSKQFIEDFGKFWELNPELTFGDIIIELFTGTGNQFSILQFSKQKTELWELTLEALMETL